MLPFSRKKNQEDRYYLFPGAGREAARRKRRVFLAIAFTSGILAAAGVAIFLLWLNRP